MLLIVEKIQFHLRSLRNEHRKLLFGLKVHLFGRKPISVDAPQTTITLMLCSATQLSLLFTPQLPLTILTFCYAHLLSWVIHSQLSPIMLTLHYRNHGQDQHLVLFGHSQQPVPMQCNSCSLVMVMNLC